MRRTRVFASAALAAFFMLAATANAADWWGSFDASYQAAQPGDTIVVPTPVTTLGNTVVGYRANVANLADGCTPSTPAKCIHVVVDHPVTINGALEVRGSSIWIDGGADRNLRVTGYVDTEADSSAQHPDHVIIEGARSTAFGVFNVDTVTFRNMDVGPQTLGAGCGAVQGRGLENKIGYGGGVVYVPRNVTLDGLRVHNQNVNSAGRASDCHFGGLFLVTVDGLTIKNSTFERNVVYHIQIQNFGGAPAAKRVVIDHNSFGCPVEWLDEKGENVCDGQAAVQFDYDPAGQFALTNNVAANGTSGLYGCYVGGCGGFGSLIQSGNVNLDASPVAPPLLGGTTPPPPSQCSDGKDNDGDGKVDLADPGCSGAADNDETDLVQPPPVCPGTTLALTVVSQTATTVTLGWVPPNGSEWYTFWTAASPASTPVRVSNGPAVLANGSVRNTVKFAKVPAGGCYRVKALGPIADGGAAG